MKFPSFEELAELVRTSAQLKRSERIDPDSQLRRDLKVHGRHAADLLNAIESHFGIQFPAAIRNDLREAATVRCPDESPVVESLFASLRQDETPWTVGRLYKAVLEQLNRTQEQPLSRR
jgi:acyl carrier protein